MRAFEATLPIVVSSGIDTTIGNVAELAPWRGGFYERLVGVVKSTLKSIVGRRFLKWEEFVTLIAETEAIVNSRPITYVHCDIESGVALRPMDFIVELPTGTPNIDPNVRPQGGEATKFLLVSWKAKQRRLHTVWRQWYQDYLLSLRERYQMSHKSPRSKTSIPPQTGEVVIVKNVDAPRGHWKLARILNLIPSKDGSVRSAELMLPSKLIIRRPINHLYRLEVPQLTDDTTTTTEAIDANPKNQLTSDEEGFAGFDADEVEASEQRAATIFAARDKSEQIDIPALTASCRRTIAAGLASRAVPLFF